MKTRFKIHALPGLFSLALSAGVPAAHAAKLGGVEMPDTQQVAGKALVLNGMGMREATMFKVKVYVAGLYLENASNSGQEILDSPQIKKLDLHFVRDVGVDKIRDAWEEGFKNNCGGKCDALRPSLAKLNAAMDELKPGDRLSFTFHPDKFEAAVKNASPFSIESGDFSRVMLAIWLGKEPPNESLKKGLLGLAGK